MASSGAGRAKPRALQLPRIAQGSLSYLCSHVEAPHDSSGISRPGGLVASMAADIQYQPTFIMLHLAYEPDLAT